MSTLPADTRSAKAEWARRREAWQGPVRRRLVLWLPRTGATFSFDAIPAQTLYRLTADSRGHVLERCKRETVHEIAIPLSNGTIMPHTQYLKRLSILAASGLLAACSGAQAQPTSIPSTVPGAPGGGATYADLADLADRANLVIQARIREQAELSPERAPNVAPGHTRLYIEAQTVALLGGGRPIGESLKYLVDVPVDEDGDAPDLEDREVILFALAGQGRPGEVQLVGPTAQLPWSPGLEARLRPILAEMAAPDAPPTVVGVRDILSMPGNLAGESETQIFLETDGDGPVSITVVRRPNMSPVWGVSWTEIVDQAARPPARDTLAWYRIACFLPDEIPEGALLSRDPASQAQAVEDFRFVQQSLGPCHRNRS